MTVLQQLALSCCTGFVIGELLFKVGYLIYIVSKNKKLEKELKEIKEDGKK